MTALGAVEEVEPTDYELWDGEAVVLGQPTAWHEAVRAALIGQLTAQVAGVPELAVVASAPAGRDDHAPRSDGAVLDTADGTVLLWVEVLSASDLSRGDRRLTGGRRRARLRDEGIDQVLVLADHLGTLSATLLEAHGVRLAAAPATLALRLQGRAEELTVDLAALAAAGEAADGLW